MGDLWDSVDGDLARKQGTASPEGAIFDAVLDRHIDFLVIGALTFVPFTPDSPFSRFSALPIQIFNWTARPQAGFQEAAAAGIIVLLVALLVLNAGAVFLRNKFQNRDGG